MCFIYFTIFLFIYFGALEKFRIIGCTGCFKIFLDFELTAFNNCARNIFYWVLKDTNARIFSMSVELSIKLSLNIVES